MFGFMVSVVEYISRGITRTDKQDISLLAYPPELGAMLCRRLVLLVKHALHLSGPVHALGLSDEEMVMCGRRGCRRGVH